MEAINICIGVYPLSLTIPTPLMQPSNPLLSSPPLPTRSPLSIPPWSRGSHPCPSGPGPPPSSAPDRSNRNAVVPLVPATYIVRAPKDQIFRVPPPENALYVEQYRNTIKNRRRAPACYSWVTKALAVALLVLVVCLVAALSFYLVVKPADPSFTVKDVVVVVVRGPHSNPRFSVVLTAKNPSAKMGYLFEKGGKASLSSGEKKIASGESPAFDVPYRSSEDFKVLLGDLKTELPEKVKSSLKGSKDVVSLTLSVDLPVRSAIAGVRLWLKRMNAVCDFRASNLEKGAHIVWQSCEAKFR